MMPSKNEATQKGICYEKVYCYDAGAADDFQLPDRLRCKV